MKTLPRLTPRAERLARDLARKVRRITMPQVLAGYHPGATHPRAAERTVRSLEAAGLVSRHTVLASPLPDMREPVYAGKPGQPLRCPKSVSRVLRLRWNDDPQPTVVYAATPKACRMFGAPRRQFIEPTKVGHDLGLTGVFVLALRERPDVARRWAGETLYGSLLKGEKLPDALILDDAGRPELIVECGGGYGPEHVAAFVASCVERKLPFEIW